MRHCSVFLFALCALGTGPLPLADPAPVAADELRTADAHVRADIDLVIDLRDLLAYENDAPARTTDVLRPTDPVVRPAEVASQTTVGRRPELRQRV